MSKSKYSSNNKYVIVLIVRIISIILIGISSYYIFLWYLDNKNTADTLNSILDNANISYEKIELNNNLQTSILKVDFDKIMTLNQDIVGWINVLGTDINYPVVQTTDNDFYLTHSFDKSYNKSGWIFADYTNINIKENNLDKNTVIYGHNRKNNSMFGTLSNTLKEEWQNNMENRYINFSTLNQNMVWQVFSTYTIESEDYYIKTHFSSDIEYNEFLNTIKSRSNYNFNVDISTDDKVLTLSTCTNIGKGRSVLHAKLIK